MKKLFLLFSHEITDEQLKDAKKNMGIDDIVNMPEELKKNWKSISPKGELNLKKIEPVLKWLKKESSKGDYVLVQGEYGVTFYIVGFCFKNNLIPIYATSKRVYKEDKNQDGSVVRKHIFKHVNFRKYEKFEL